MMDNLIRILLLSFTLVSGLPLKDDEKIFPIRMPFVKPRLPQNETYLCTATDVDPDRTLYVTGVAPVDLSMGTVHHLMLIGCSNVDYGGENDLNPRNLWNCGGTLGERGLDYAPPCQGGDIQVLYMWSRNGSSVEFPPDSGIPVGGPDSAIQLLVLQVHYIHNGAIPWRGDRSGVSVRYTGRRPLRSVGIVSLHVHGVLAPHAVSFWDAACRFPLLPGQRLHPFAFLAHTHGRGVHASGWVVRDNTTWEAIGTINPQEPQSFYPALSPLEIGSEDAVATRCILQSDSSSVIHQGLTSGMEMCDYFILYWTDDGPPLATNNTCTTKDGFTWNKFGLINDPFHNNH